MKKIILIVLLVFNVGITMQAFSQVFDSPPRDSPWDITNARDRKVVPYAAVREADVSWYTKIWRVIDFREKMNLPLYYPDDVIRDRSSFMQVIWNGLKEGTLTAYENDEFLKPISFTELLASLEDTVRDQKEDLDNPGVMIDTVYQRKFETGDIKQIRLKEVQFFDKQRSVMDVRILGFCPLLKKKDEKGNFKEALAAPFWIYFPDARPLLARTEVYNPKNSAERRTLDDIFQKRYFQSYIIKEDNTYNRWISNYKTGLDALIEGEVIKEKLFSIEHDLWEF
ncbi:MAG: gliding motility protein GldN [Bacteroidales bacterium]